MGYIYKISNKVNNYNYVGQTVNPIQNRWNQHLNTYNNKNSCSFNYVLYKAMRKYGIENFTIEQIEECNNSLLDERERYWIKKLNSFYLNGCGYNMTFGGEGIIKYSDDDILALWEQGLKVSQIAEKLNALPSTISQRLQTLKPGEARKRHFNSLKKEVLQYDLNGNFIKEWDSAADAEKELSTGYGGNITRCCKKERTMAYNYLWKYKDDKTPIIKLMVNYANSLKCNGVDRIDKNGNILEHFNTAAEAERKRNITRGRISTVCNSIKQSKAGGCYWQWSYPLKRELVKYKRESEGEQTL